MSILPIYRKEIVITPEFLDEMHHVNNLWHVHWMQEAAREHSAANGWSVERYVEAGLAWFVRRHTINYLHPILLNDVILVETWVHELKNVSSIRQYRILRKSDGVELANGETKWGMVNMETGRPTKVPPELAAIFEEIRR